MADVKISELTEQTSTPDTDLIEIEKAVTGESRKSTKGNFLADVWTAINERVRSASLGLLAFKNTVNDDDFSGTALTLEKGGTGGTSASQARTNLGAAASVHTHAIADVDGLQTALNGKAGTSHTHAISDVTNLQTTLNGKAPSTHTHAIGDVTGLQTALDGKAGATHSHLISDITGLQATLDAATDAGYIVTGTFADARIAASSVVQHQGAINHDALSNVAADRHRKITISTLDPSGGADGDVWIKVV